VGKNRGYRLVVFLLISVLLSCFLCSCVGWEDVGEGVAKGQGTLEVELAKQETAVAKGVATAAESYGEERERQGKDTCASAMLPLLVVGLAYGAAKSRHR
jgi:hypothetical protein